MRPPPAGDRLSRRTNTFALASPSHECRALPSAARPRADGRRHPTTRAPLALLGPCFKTGLGGPTLRQRPGPQRVARIGRGPARTRRTRPRQRDRRRGPSGTEPAGRRPTDPLRRRSDRLHLPGATRRPTRLEAPDRTGRTGCTCLRGRRGDRDGSHLPAARMRPDASPLTVTPAARVCREAARPLRLNSTTGSSTSALRASLPTVSRSLELSLQSAFHLSLTVLVLYRSRAGLPALDGVYHPIWAAFPNNPTRRVRTLVPPLPVSRPYGALTLSGTPFQVDFGPEGSGAPGQPASPDHNSPVSRWARPEISDLGSFPLRSPLLRESQLVSLPPLIDMLKFGG